MDVKGCEGRHECYEMNVTRKKWREGESKQSEREGKRM